MLTATRRALWSVLLLAVSTNATQYYVAPSGDDAYTGLTPAEAWQSIDNGAAKEILVPGDTVNILPGNYLIPQSVDLKTSGTGTAPILYRGLNGRPVIDGQSGSFDLVTVSASFVQVQNLEFTGSTKVGVMVKGDSCVVHECYIHDVGTEGISIESSGNLVTRTILLGTGNAGIFNKKGALSNRYFGNTIHATNTGIDIQVNESSARIFNNIITDCVHGISGVAGNVCAFNILWNNQAGPYFGGVVDSAGGMIADPMFLDTTNHDLRLNFGSPAIDAGVDLGYSFNGLAPDIGALECGELARLEIFPVRDTLSADSAYQFSALAYDSANLAAASGNLIWSHTFPTGIIDSTGLFTPVGTASGRVTVNSDLNGISAQTGLMTIRPGSPVSFSVAPDTLTIASGNSQTFAFKAYDLQGNQVVELGQINWTVNGGIGTIDSTGLFVAHVAGTGTIEAQSSLGFTAVSGQILVVPGPVVYLDVLPAVNIVPTLTSYQYTAIGYDSDSNFIADYTDSVIWSTTDLVGGITATGMYSAGPVGTYWIKAAEGIIRDSGSVMVTLGGGLDHIRVEYFDGTPVGATILSTDNDTTRFYARGYSAVNALIGDVSVDWTIVGADTNNRIVPAVGTNAKLVLKRPGDIRVSATHVEGPVDTTGVLTIVTGQPVSLDVFPDTATVAIGATLGFSAIARDVDRNVTVPQPVVSWSVTDSIGSITVDGMFTSLNVGQGYVVASAGLLVDSSGPIQVTPGQLSSIHVVPDSVTVGIGDTVYFTAIGLDSAGNVTDPGVVTWLALGRVGNIDADGRYIAEAPGTGAVSATNSIAGIADTTGSLRVEELFFSTIPLGDGTIRPNGDATTVQAFRLENYYATTKTVTSIAVNDLSSGAGSSAQLAANMTTASVYADLNSDSTLTGVDSLLGTTPYLSGHMTLAISSIDIPADSGMTFLVTATSAALARDGDTVDVALIPGLDIETADLTIVAGPPLSNSRGITEIDGMVAGQIGVVSGGNNALRPDDSLVLCFAFDLPRNGYQPDTLKAVDIINSGSAVQTDISEFALYADNGDAVWGGPSAEISLGSLVFNGETWSRGGLSHPLPDIAARFFVTARPASFPHDGATIILGMPINGVRVSSNNDGPLDALVTSPDTITIQGRQALLASSVPIPSHSCTPGQNTGPVLAIELVNGYAETIAIDTIRFSFVGIDPQGAIDAQLAGQIDSVFLYLDKDNDITSVSSADSLIAVDILVNSVAVFDASSLPLAGSGGTQTVFVTAKLSLTNAKNGNTVAFRAVDSTAFICDRPVRVNGTFPLTNAAPFIIDAFPAASVTVHVLPPVNLYAGQTDQLVFDFELPRNGYAADLLSQLNLLNSGSLPDNNLLQNVRLWQDETGDGFTPDDPLLGEFTASGNLWRLDGQKAALDSVANRFFVTVSISDKQLGGGTIRFDIPVQGVRFASGSTGPDDQSVVNPSSFVIFPSNRVTAISIPINTTTVYPGATGNVLMTFALYNGYLGQTKTLAQVTLTNASRSASSTAFADHELGQVSLYLDMNQNRVFDNDSVIGTGLFAQGKLRFEGLSTALPSESLAYFFVAATLPTDLIDSDSLFVVIEQPTDLAFTELVNLNGDLPLSSGGSLVVDGSVRRQYRQFGPVGRSLTPGDSDVVFLAFSPAANGDRMDELQQIALVNMGSGDTASFANLELWLDTDANRGLSTGDSLVGAFVYDGGVYTAQGLSIPVPPTPPGLLVVGDISISALPDATFRAEIPLTACAYGSANDGPIDSSIAAAGVFTVSTSGLRVAPDTLRASYSVGQSIEVSIATTNVTSGTISAVATEIVNISDSQLVRLDSSIAGPLDLGAGQTFTSRFYFTAVGQGAVWWQLRSVSQASADSSPVIQTAPTTIQRAISPVNLQLLNTSPTAVTRGQTNIFCMTLKCPHPDSDPSVAAMALESFHVKVVDGQGVDVPASSVFSRMVLTTGLDILGVITVVPAQTDIVFSFGTPLVVVPGASQNLMLVVDVDSNAVPAGFMIAIDSASWVPWFDANTGQLIPTGTATVYPLRSEVTRIDSPAEQIAVSAVSCALPTINYAQQRVDILKLYVRHTGALGYSSVQLTRLALAVVDSNGVALAAGDLFSEIELHKPGNILGSVVPLPNDTNRLDIPLTTPVNLNPLELDSMYVAVTVKPFTGEPGFSLIIADSTNLTVRDLNTGAAVPTVPDTALASGTVFPIVSAWTSFRMPAQAPLLCLADIAIPSVSGGADSVPLFAYSVTYSASAAYSNVRLTRVGMRPVDGGGTPLDPNQLLDRIGYRVGTGPIWYAPSLTVASGELTLMLGDTGLVLAPADSLTIQIVGDLRLEAPYSEFAFSVTGAVEFDVIDVSDTTNRPGLATAPGCSQSFPFTAGLTSIVLPAGRPQATRSDLPVRIAGAGSRGVELFDGSLTYSSASPVGQIEVRGLTAALKRRPSGNGSLEPARASIDVVHLEINGLEVGTDSLLAQDSISIVMAAPLMVSRGDMVSIRLTCDLSESAPVGNIVVIFADSSFLQITDRSSATTVYPVLSGVVYPVDAGEISVVAADLGASFTNYPNPFNPARNEATTIGFVLNEAATIDIDIFTVTGEPVTNVVRHEFRAAGAYQSDSWGGNNGVGRTVQPGVYFCRITATYETGRIESFRRKIAVVR
ncbi:MAG: right-handed parallel beta-helix repeat-containing protein [Candidatus Zixiibacteriota bacterium]